MTAGVSTLALTADDRAMLAGIAAGGDRLVDRAVAWCAINTGSRNLDGLAQLAGYLEAAMARLPGPVERVRLDDTISIGADGNEQRQSNGEALRLRVRPQAPVQVVLTGHYDTVFPAQTGFREVATRADGALHGPGVADMKGGLSVMLGALAAFESHPAASLLGYSVLISPDEETGSLASAPLLAELGKLGHVGMTYEPALSDGTLVGERKGTGNFHLVVRGRAAHAGRDFALGRNAVLAAARLADTLALLNGEREGVTLNVARIEGGSPLNMVPDLAVLRFNVRFPDADAAQWLRAEIDAAAAAANVGGIEVAVHGGFSRPAKPFNAAQAELFSSVKAVGALLGQEISWVSSGGVCEGNNLFAAGLPNVDTLGVRGGDIHTEDEFAWPESFLERAQLSALILAKLAVGEIDAQGLRRRMETLLAQPA